MRAGRFAPVLGVFLGLLLTGAPASGQTVAPKPAALAQAKTPLAATQKQEYPLHISAAQMEADQDQRLITFTGQVKADYGDYTLYSDKLLIYYKPKEKGPAPAPPGGKGQKTPQASQGSQASPLGGMGGDKIDHIEAIGNVRCVQGDRVATGEKAIYYKDKDIIVLLGHPQVWRGEDLLERVKDHPEPGYQQSRGGKLPGTKGGGPPVSGRQGREEPIRSSFYRRNQTRFPDRQEQVRP